MSLLVTIFFLSTILSLYLIFKLALATNSRRRGSFSYVESRYSLLKFYSGLFVSFGFILILGDEFFTKEFIKSNNFLSKVESLSNYFAGIILFLLGLLLFFFSSNSLKNSIFNPLKEIFTSLSVFGTEVVHIALPEIGTNETKEFSANFKENSANLANKISVSHVQIGHLNNLILELKSLIEDEIDILKPVADLIDQSDQIVLSQNDLISKLSKNNRITEDWQEEYNIDSNTWRADLRESVEYLNLLTINIAIEAANAENLAFETIADKSRDFFKEFEDFSDRSSKRYDFHSDKFTETIKNLSEITKVPTISSNRELILEADLALKKQNQLRIQINDISKQINQLADELKINLPSGY